jgi:peptidoglycan/LPS O-acetylase OafA/YrhL
MNVLNTEANPSLGELTMGSAVHEFKLSRSSSLLLDLLRGLSAQAVVIGHGLSFFGVTDRLPFVQNSAVVAFFILSGIVIPYSAWGKKCRNEDFSFLSYFIDRFSRIYTGFVPALLFVAAADFLSKSMFGSGYIYSEAFNFSTFFGNLLMLQDFPLMKFLKGFHLPHMSLVLSWLTPPTSFGSARPLWTVAVEWWIYLLFGWIVLGSALRRERRFGFWSLLAFLLIVPGINLVDGRGNGLTMVWLLGLLAYIMLSNFSLPLSNRELCLLAGAFLLAAFVRLYFTREAYDLVYAGLLALALFFVLCFLQRHELAIPGMVAFLITFNANISYTLYLTHYTLLDMLHNWRGQSAINVLIGFLISNVVAIAIYLIFDRHHPKVRVWLKQTFKVAG